MGVKGLIPTLVKMCIKLERIADPAAELQAVVNRCYVLKMMNLAIAVASCYEEMVVIKHAKCFETELGKFVLKAYCMDTLISSISFIVLNVMKAKVLPGLRAKPRHYCCCSSSAPKQRLEFDFSGPVIDLMYRTVLMWTGVAFCPVLPAFFLVLESWCFYSQYWTIKACCRPPDRPFEATRAVNFYMRLLLASLALSIAPGLWFMNHHIQDCGPHKDESPIEGITQYVTVLDDWSGGWLELLTEPLALFCALLLSLTVLFFRGAHLQKAHLELELLRKQVSDEHDEKVALVRKYRLKV